MDTDALVDAIGYALKSCIDGQGLYYAEKTAVAYTPFKGDSYLVQIDCKDWLGAPGGIDPEPDETATAQLIFWAYKLSNGDWYAEYYDDRALEEDAFTIDPELDNAAYAWAEAHS